MRVLYLFVLAVDSAVAHSYMVSPVIRGARDANKESFWAAADDERNRCPGFQGKKFGAELNSKFLPGEVYKAGGSVDIELHMMPLHKGPIWMEFACMDGYGNESTDDALVTWEKLGLDNGKTEIESEHLSNMTGISTDGKNCTCKFVATLPVVNCAHGVLVSNWHNVGSASREVFKHCADIKVETALKDLPTLNSDWMIALIIGGAILAICAVGGLNYLYSRCNPVYQPTAFPAKEVKLKPACKRPGSSGSTQRRKRNT